MISAPVYSGHAESCRRTFLKTMASSSQTGLMALPCDVLVLNAFLLVSTGKPNMSISTYVPTFLSDRNWPEMILKEGRESKNEEKKKQERKGNTQLQADTNLYRKRIGYYPVHCALGERVKVLVRPPHKLGLESVATFAVVLIHAQVQLHGQI